MRNDYIFNVPASTFHGDLPLPVQGIIASLGAVYPSFPMVGSIEFSGRKLIHVNMAGKYLKAQFEGLFTLFGLDWIILSIRSDSGPYEQEYLAPRADFQPFFANTTDPIYLSCYAGTEPLEIV
jgi:hypothetical protein